MKRFTLLTAFLALSLVTAASSSDGNGHQEQKETRPVQVTFITPFGTNGIDAPHIQNKFSLNILTGVNGGVQGLEVGGLVNVTTGSIKGTQVAGLGNYVHNESTGAQIGGLFNVGRGYVNGLQVGGLLNVSLEGGRGNQTAGLLNVNNGGFTGLQVGGLVNANIREVKGLQIAGLINYAGGEVTSGQIGGLVNVGLGDTRGIQIGGLVNVSGKSHHGSQVSGLVNVAAVNVAGSQVGGIANYSKKVRGVQIGLINVADSIEGAQVGLISYAGNGMISLGARTDETFQGSIVFKMGLKKLYNIYQIGGHEGNNRYWAPGLGLGSYVIDRERIGFNIEGIAYQVNEDEWWTDQLNMLVRLNLGLEYHIAPKISIAGGLSLNQAISQVRDSEGALTGGSFVPEWSFYEHGGDRTFTTLYPGFHAGLEFRIK